MRTVGGMIVAFLAVAAAARADDVENARLQGTLQLPHVSLVINFNDVEGLTAADRGPDPRKRLEEVRAALKDDDSDAGRYLDLGDLYHDLGDDGASRKAYVRSAELYRRQAEAAPDKADLLLPLGKALRAAHEWEEGEKVLRDAVRRNPKDWEAWAELGSFLHRRAVDELFGGPDHWTKQLGLGELYQMALDEKFAREDAERADELLAEADRCFDRAVESAPDRPEAYTTRAGFLVWQKELRLSIDIAARGRTRPFDQTVPEESLADMRKAIELGLKDPHEIARAACFETVAGVARDGGRRQPQSLSVWAVLPEESREHVRRGLGLLGKLAEDDDPARKAEALRTLALLQCAVVGDKAAGEKTIRRVLELDPTNAAAWELLLAIAAERESDRECMAICKERVKQCDGPRSRLLLAMGHVRLGDFAAAEEQYRAAVKMDPDDFFANLSLATILLKRAGDRESFTEAFAQLQRTVRMLTPGVPAKDKLHLAALVGVAKAINGQADEGRRILERVQFEDPEHEIARDALEVLKK